MPKNTTSLASANFAQLCRLARDHVDVGDFTIMPNGHDKVWISEQAIGHPRTQNIEIPRATLNRLIRGYLKQRKFVRKAFR